MEFLVQLPEGYHFRKGHGKALLREALPEWIPPDLRWRNKQGFTPPLAKWFRSTLQGVVGQSLREIPKQLAGVVFARSCSASL